jgi:hypothetical protein
MSLGKEMTFTYTSFQIFTALFVQKVMLWAMSWCSLVGESSLEIEIEIMLLYKYEVPQLKQQISLEIE